MKKTIWALLALVIIPIGVYADNFEINCPSSVEANKEFSCTIKATSSDFIFSYYASLALNNVSYVSDTNKIYSSGSISADGLTLTSPAELTKMTFKATHSGSIILQNASINGNSINNAKATIKVKSSVSNIKVNGGDIGFSSDKYEYNITKDSSSGEFKVSATGDGITYKNSSGGSSNVIKIDYGKTGTITITGSDGIIYKVNITREDTRKSDTTLKSLKVGDENIELTTKKEYKVEVPNKIKEIELKAEATDKNAKVEGNGKYDLAIGDNKLEIVVKSESGEEETYKITVTRKEAVDLKGKDNLKSLEINGVKIKKITNTIYAGVSNDEEKLKLDYTLIDDSGEVEYDEDYTLKTGINKVTIKVTDGSGKEKKYTLIIIKEKDKTIVNNKKDKIITALQNGDVTVRLTNKDDKIVSKEILSKLNGNKLTYEILGDNDVIMYSVTFSGKELENYGKDINFDIEFNTKKQMLINDKYYNIRFLNDTVLPSKVKVKIFIKDKFQNNDGLYLYNYNGSKKLGLINDNVKYKDYYVNFDIDHLSEYVLTKDEIIYKMGLLPILLIILAVLLVGGLITFLIIRKKKNPKPKTKKKKTKKVKEKVIKPVQREIEEEIYEGETPNEEPNISEELEEETKEEHNNSTTEEELELDDDFASLLNDNYKKEE